MDQRTRLAGLFAGADRVNATIAQRAAEPADHDPDVELTVAQDHPGRLELLVSEVIEETPTTRTFRLARPEGGALPPFQAGQYVNVFVSDELGDTSRPLAISSGPGQREHYDVTVRRVAGGRISNHLIDHVVAGTQLTTSGPMGTFHHNPLFHGDDVIFLAGGSGIAPAMSMIRELVESDRPRRIHLIYGSVNLADVIFRAELDGVVDERVRVDHVSDGLITSAVIDRLVGPLAGRMVYVCGPQAMYPYALDQLTALGHPRRRVRFEANGAPAAPSAEPGWPSKADPAGLVTIRVQGGPVFTSPRGRPLLDALEDAGVTPEAACRSGECSLCRVRVISGQVFTAAQAQLRLSDGPFGWTHSCVAYPITDVEIAV